MNSSRISYIEKRLQELEAEKEILIQELEQLKIFPVDNNQPCLGIRAFEKTPETVEEKISLFLSLFRCREDLYSHLWENKRKATKGFSPVCTREWISGVCRKPSVKCHECPERNFKPFNGITARAHLEGEIVVGSYAINGEDKCVFLAADFDGNGWKEDSLSYRWAAGELGVDIALEISRSGNGAHAWIFFSHPVPARMARNLGTVIMSHASSSRLSLNFNSYDRFFPSQDYLPEGGFGNLIALPLQKASRKKGATVFVDESFTPYIDQWEYLSNIRLLSFNDLEDLLRSVLHPSGERYLYESRDQEVLDAEGAISVQRSDNKEPLIQGRIDVRVGAKIAISVNSIPTRLVYALKRLATFANPKYFELQRLRFSTWKTPRYICCAELIENTMYLPRGTFEECEEMIKSSGGEMVIHDERINAPAIEVRFIGALREEQEKAVQSMLEHNYGVLVAPPGLGKTVMACAVLAARGVPTLVLVHRKQLIEQWKSQIITHLGVEKKLIGVLGGAGKKIKGFIDIATLQTLTRMKDPAALLSHYGMIVIDECHHVPAVSFESVLSRFAARYFLGLTATPYRKDGLQPIIHMQCGPIRHTIQSTGFSAISRKVVVKETGFTMPSGSDGKPALHEIWEAIVNDEKRLRLIADDVKVVLESGRFPLVLSDRKEHLFNLSQYIRECTIGIPVVEFILIGDMGKKARGKVLDEIKVSRDGVRMPYILSTSSLIGEGFDLPELDTLFITMPVSFKGRVVQYAGRLHRETPDKRMVVIYDYCDSALGLTISMFKKRLSAYREMGYELELPDSEKIRRLVKKSSVSVKTLFH